MTYATEGLGYLILESWQITGSPIHDKGLILLLGQLIVAAVIT